MSATSGTLAELIEHERGELLQIHAMVRCLNQVLLHADDDDSPLHADVAQVIARLLNESVVRLEGVRVRVAELEAATNQPSSPPNQVRESRPDYAVVRLTESVGDGASVRNSMTGALSHRPLRNLGEQCAIA